MKLKSRLFGPDDVSFDDSATIQNLRLWDMIEVHHADEYERINRIPGTIQGGILYNNAQAAKNAGQQQNSGEFIARFIGNLSRPV